MNRDLIIILVFVPIAAGIILHNLSKEWRVTQRPINKVAIIAYGIFVLVLSAVIICGVLWRIIKPI